MSSHDSKFDDRMSPTLTDEQIVTERLRTRRSFLTATGVVLGGAVALVAAGCTDPDSKKPASEPAKPATPSTAAPSSDPDSKK